MKTNTLKEHIRLLRLAIELGDTWEQYRLIHGYKFDNESAVPKDECPYCLEAEHVGGCPTLVGIGSPSTVGLGWKQ